jgi:hypothetical protein
VFRFWGLRVIFLYTDFGAEGPDLAQPQAVLAACAANGSPTTRF